MSFMQKILGGDGANQLAIKARYGGSALDGVAQVATYPMNLGASGGSYSAAATSGVIAAGLAGASEIFQFRFVSATKLAVIRSIRISAAVNTTAFGAASAAAALSLHFARAWSVAGTGGTAVTLATNEGKRRTSFPTSEIASGDIRVATTTALGAGTKTIDVNPLSTIMGQTGIAGLQIVAPFTPIWDQVTGSAHPLVLATQEGLAIRATVPGTGTWSFAVSVDWGEVLAADF